MLSLHSTIQTMQFYIQQKEQNRLKYFLSNDLTIQAMYYRSERSIFLSHQFKSAGEIMPI